MKKCILMVMMILLSSLFCMRSIEAKSIVTDNTLVMAYSTTTDYNRDDDFDTNCQDFAHTLRMGGYLVFILRIVIPLVMIVKASIDLVKVVTAGNADEVNKFAKKLGTMVAAGVLIFLIPTLINTMFGFISGFNSKMTGDAKVCTACVFEPFSQTCKKYAD